MASAPWILLVLACGRAPSEQAHDHGDNPLPVPMEVMRARAPEAPPESLAFTCVVPAAEGTEAFFGGFDADGEAVFGAPVAVGAGGALSGRMPANATIVRIWISGYAPVDATLTPDRDGLQCGSVPALARPGRLRGTVSGRIEGAWVEACGQRAAVGPGGGYDLMIPAERTCEVVAARKTADDWTVSTHAVSVTLQDHEIRTLDLALPETD